MTVGKRRIFAAMISLMSLMILLLSTLPKTIAADGDGGKSLTLTCNRDGMILSGMEWKLYKVGERRNGDFVLTGDFAKYPVYLKDMSAAAVTAAAKTLESYATVDKIPPVGKGVTDKNGELTFTGLEKGLYLADGKLLKIGDVYYVPSSLLLEVSDEGDSFRYDAYPKFYYATLNEEVTSYTVKKVWVGDEEDSIARPVDVTVDIYRDDEFVETVILNEKNNWYYYWLDDEGLAEWFVVERDIPVNYDVAVEANETQYLIKNSYGREVLTDPVTTTTTTTTSTATTTSTTTQTTAAGEETSSSAPVNETETSTPADTPTSAAGSSAQSTAPVTTTTASSGGGLISTGQLWWPVIPLGIGGVLLIVVAVAIKPKKENNEN